MVESLFPVAIGVALVELVLSGMWVPVYFRIGFPLFVKSFRFSGDSCEIDVAALSSEFAGRIAPPLVFRPLDSGEIAFREKLICFSWFSYTPVMHGLIRADRDTRTVSTTGYANWFPVFFIVLFVSFGLSLPGGGPDVFFFVVFPALLLAALYLIQFYRFSKVHTALAIRHSEENGLRRRDAGSWPEPGRAGENRLEKDDVA
jgi:hypothetical protein